MTNNRSVEISKERVGEISITKFGTPMKIIKYENAMKILVEFQDEHKFKKYTTYCNFKNGICKNPFDKRYLNIGYLGTEEIVHNKKSFKTWTGILERCYSSYKIEKHPTYKDCSVCEEWQCYANFEKWYNEHYYECPIGGRMCLDKDILVKGNKVYSPNTCCFVPNDLNILFTQVTLNKINGYPKGITKANQKYRVRVRDEYNKPVDLGVYSNIDDAVKAYSIEKRSIIKRKADIFKEYIPNYIYKAIIDYEV